MKEIKAVLSHLKSRLQSEDKLNGYELLHLLELIIDKLKEQEKLKGRS